MPNLSFSSVFIPSLSQNNITIANYPLKCNRNIANKSIGIHSLHLASSPPHSHTRTISHIIEKQIWCTHQTERNHVENRNGILPVGRVSVPNGFRCWLMLDLGGNIQQSAFCERGGGACFIGWQTNRFHRKTTRQMFGVWWWKICGVFLGSGAISQNCVVFRRGGIARKLIDFDFNFSVQFQLSIYQHDVFFFSNAEKCLKLAQQTKFNQISTGWLFDQTPGSTVGWG